ncbi:DUF1361 domain-containing protein [Patescibacteria group bacterium]
MKNKTSLKVLFALSVMLFILLIIRVLVTERTGYLFLLWNLFLAWVPLLLSLVIIDIYSKKYRFKNFLLIIVGLFWLFFYPNAPYLITDFIHLDKYTFMTLKEQGNYFSTYVFHTDLLMWFDFTLLSIAIGIGILLGFISLFILHKIVKKHFNSMIGWLFVTIVTFLTSIAIYIGRFIRFNSWDIFSDPFEVLRVFIENINYEFLIFVGLFFILLKGSYIALYSLLSLSKK